MHMGEMRFKQRAREEQAEVDNVEGARNGGRGDGCENHSIICIFGICREQRAKLLANCLAMWTQRDS